MKRPMLRTTAILLAFLGGTALALAQASGGPDPAQAGSDPSMSQPQPHPGQLDRNPAAAVGATEGSAQNAEHLPSPQDAAKHNAAVAAHDKIPIVGLGLGLTEEQQREIYQSIAQSGSETTATGSSAGAADVKVSEIVPESLELRPLPESVTAKFPNTRGYEYAQLKDRLLLAEPHRHAVVTVIQR